MNESLILPILLGEFYDKLKFIKDLVSRDVKFPNASNKIKVLIGMRRAGKTYFLYQQILRMLKEGIDKKSILYINFEDDRLIPLNEKKLARLVDSFYAIYPENHDRKCYLFFDEIQNVDNWPQVIRRLHDTKNIEIFLTGSSAKLLSKEIASSLRGRSLSTEIWPYSFSEFIRAKKITIDRSIYDKRAQDISGKVFLQYISDGGFPEVVSFDTDIRIKTLQEYLDVVIFRDTIERYNIKNPSVIKYMILLMINNVGKPFSINKLYNDLKGKGYRTSKDLLYEYANYIEDAYLAFAIPVYDKSIRKIHVNPKKLYAIDPGMVRALTLDFENDLGRLFENIIFLELKRLGCKISYFLSSDRYEVDFLAQKGNLKKKLFQIVWDIQDKKTLDRERRALNAGMKELKLDGEIITLESYLKDGIRF